MQSGKPKAIFSPNFIQIRKKKNNGFQGQIIVVFLENCLIRLSEQKAMYSQKFIQIGQKLPSLCNKIFGMFALNA